MKCPKCRTELFIDHAGEEGAAYVCVNPACPLYGKTKGGARMIFDSGAVPCCGEPVAFVTDTTCSPAPGTAKTAVLEGGVLTVACPKCGRVHTFDTTRKEAVTK